MRKWKVVLASLAIVAASTFVVKPAAAKTCYQADGTAVYLYDSNATCTGNLSDTNPAAGKTVCYKKSTGEIVYIDTHAGTCESQSGLTSTKPGSSGGGSSNPGGGGSSNPGGGGSGSSSGSGNVETNILPDSAKSVDGLLNLILKILVYGLGVAAVLGVIIAGIQYMTARDNEQQMAAAKKRLIEIVIGLVAWALMYVVLNWLIPGGMSFSV